MKGHYSDIWRGVSRAVPDRPAVVTHDGSLSYGQLTRDAGALAGFLARAGLGPGDAVAIVSYNRSEYLVAVYACLASGIAPVPINFRFRAGEVAALLADSGAKAAVFPAALGETVGAAAKALTDPPVLISIDDGTPHLIGTVHYADAISGAPALPAAVPDDAELRIYTGGTTGQPKAVMWGADDLLNVQLYSIYGSSGLEVPPTIDAAIEVAADPATPRVVTLPLAPFMHATALFTSMNTLALGGTVLINAAASLDAAAALQLAREGGATRLIVAGDAVVLPLVEAAEAELAAGASPPVLGEVNSVISSGMRFSTETKRRLHALGDITITDLLASTEGGPYAMNVTGSAAELPGRLQLLPGAVVLDDDLKEVQDTPGGRGILAFRGALPKGYWRDAEKTRATFPVISGVRHVMPGDWAISDGAGHVELLGRGSAVVNTGGEKVYPAEVEEALLAHPDVRDAVVFGMPDPRLGEQVTAIVVGEDGATPDPEALREFVGHRLAGYKKPRTILVRDSLDRTPHGKVDLTALKEWTAAHL